MSVISIVHEFSVLYSSRVFQKDKKWCDGRLRYYELNNKLEVLSDDMLLVETDFYPHHAKKPLESGAFEEGNEYIFPSGKLIVEINQYLGHFERDISGVFSKKDPAAKIESAIRLEQQQSPRSRLTIENQNILKGGKSPTKVVDHAERISPNKPSLHRKIAQVGRPLGLPRTPKRMEKQSPIKGSFKIDLAKRIDNVPILLKRKNRRIPPGSNKLSRRLTLEMGPFSVMTDGKLEGRYTGITSAIPDSITDESSFPSDDDLNDIINVTQRYLT